MKVAVKISSVSKRRESEFPPTGLSVRKSRESEFHPTGLSVVSCQ